MKKTVFTLILSLMLVASMIPCVVFAQSNTSHFLKGEDIPKGATLRLPVDNSSGIIEYTDAIVDYEGQSCIDYQVLDTNSNTENSDYMFITSKKTLTNVIMLTDDRRAKWPVGDEFADYYRGYTDPATGKWVWELDENGNMIKANTYQGSGIQKWCQDYEKALPDVLRDALLNTYKIDKIDKSDEETCYFGESKLTGDKVFIPSVQEATNETYFEKYAGRVADGASPWWWTRSPEGEISQCEGVVNDDGSLIFNDEHVDFNSMRPSMNVPKAMIFENIGDNTYVMAKVRLNANGGKWNDGSENGKFYYLGDVVEMPTITEVLNAVNDGKNPQRDGYKFLGWALSESASPQEIISADTEVMPEETYYAIWEKVPDPTPDPAPDNPGNSAGLNAVDTGDSIDAMMWLVILGIAACFGATVLSAELFKRKFSKR